LRPKLWLNKPPGTFSSCSEKLRESVGPWLRDQHRCAAGRE
jgi:hypothetical protein